MICDGVGDLASGVVGTGGNIIDAGAEFLGFETDLGPGQWTSFRQIFGGAIQTGLGPLAALNEIGGAALDFAGNVGATIAGGDDDGADEGAEITDEQLAGTAEVDDRDDDGGGDGMGGGGGGFLAPVFEAIDRVREMAAEAAAEAAEAAAAEAAEAQAASERPASATVDLGVTYTIASGDTLGVIASEVASLLPPPPPPVWGPGGLVEILAESNTIADANMIFTGSPLAIPTQEELEELYG